MMTVVIVGGPYPAPAHIPTGREDLFGLAKGLPATMQGKNALITVAKGDHVMLDGRYSGIGLPAAWSSSISCASKAIARPSPGMFIQDEALKEQLKRRIPVVQEELSCGRARNQRGATERARSARLPRVATGPQRRNQPRPLRARHLRRRPTCRLQRSMCWNVGPPCPAMQWLHPHAGIALTEMC